ncbi:hypothetical protein SAMN04487830_11449 [Pseudobutyrivibrio sp. OR37]|uniref:hypothetical protein n=1 Tax=Pseudobutyrivibrio sp. OR37 TaxID=1798186 RepID=UPI0008E33DE2|nr:hypothetical protein [Pseudobutyrivibrio sp. OR37]SFH95770.1 hypothetical protein SAMN04487830_11449 [Pseudobutyrivibrio sp. OR37]
MFALLSDEELKEAYGDYRESIGEERGLKIGEEKGEKHGKEMGLLTAIEKLMKNKGFSADEAMEILDIPEEKREEYKALL